MNHQQKKAKEGGSVNHLISLHNYSGGEVLINSQILHKLSAKNVKERGVYYFE